MSKESKDTISRLEDICRQISPEIIADRSKNFNEMGLDSIDLTELTLEIEEEFDIFISDEEIPLLSTFENVVAFIENKSTKGEG